MILEHGFCSKELKFLKIKSEKGFKLCVASSKKKKKIEEIVTKVILVSLTNKYVSPVCRFLEGPAMKKCSIFYRVVNAWRWIESYRNIP